MRGRMGCGSAPPEPAIDAAACTPASDPATNSCTRAAGAISDSVTGSKPGAGICAAPATTDWEAGLDVDAVTMAGAAGEKGTGIVPGTVASGAGMDAGLDLVSEAGSEPGAEINAALATAAWQAGIVVDPVASSCRLPGAVSDSAAGSEPSAEICAAPATAGWEAGLDVDAVAMAGASTAPAGTVGERSKGIVPGISTSGTGMDAGLDFCSDAEAATGVCTDQLPGADPIKGSSSDADGGNIVVMAAAAAHPPCAGKPLAKDSRNAGAALAAAISDPPSAGGPLATDPAFVRSRALRASLRSLEGSPP